MLELVLLGKEGEEGLDDGPTASAKLFSPSGICVRGETIYICETPSLKKGTVRMLVSLSGIVKFENIWKEASVYTLRE